MNLGTGQKKYLIFAIIAISVPFLLVVILPRIISTPNQNSLPQTQRSIDEQTLKDLTPSSNVPIESSPSPESTESVRGVKITQ